MKILLETKDRNAVVNWMVSVLSESYEYYTSLFKCTNREMSDFLNGCIKERLCDHSVHLGSGFVENIGNILCNYIFCINCGEGEEEGTYKIIYDGGHNDYFVDNWLDWSLWDDYDKCLKEACSIFESNF
jgi:hypothetical protein